MDGFYITKKYEHIKSREIYKKNRNKMLKKKKLNLKVRNLKY